MRPERSHIPARLAAPVMALALVLAACSGGGSATAAPAASAAPAPAASAASAPAASAAPAGGAGDAVTIKDFAFAPGATTVAVGATVTWTNKDTAGHTVTAVDGSFDSKTLASGATFSQTFDKAGTYSYKCTIHSSMTGTIVVK